MNHAGVVQRESARATTGDRVARRLPSTRPTVRCYHRLWSSTEEFSNQRGDEWPCCPPQRPCRTGRSGSTWARPGAGCARGDPRTAEEGCTTCTRVTSTGIAPSPMAPLLPTEVVVVMPTTRGRWTFWAGSPVAGPCPAWRSSPTKVCTCCSLLYFTVYL